MESDTKNNKLVDSKFMMDGKECHLVVSEPMGAGGGYHVFVNNYYKGCIGTCSRTGWRHHLHDSGIPE